MAFADDVIKLVKDWDAARPRSLQSEVGWSEVGGCRAYLAYRLEGAWPSDEPDGWAAVRGTAIHALLEEVLGEQYGMTTEVTTRYRGILGHADLLVDATSVTDHKTTSLANSRTWQADPKTLRQKRIQAQGYAAGLVDDGKLPPDCTVRLLVIPVDGTYEDWWAWEEPFSRALADEGADRLDDVRRRLALGDSVPKDKPYIWCQSWCEFFTLCRGADDPKAAQEITDPEHVAAIAAYGEAAERASAADKAKKMYAPLIRGLRGATDTWRISLGEDGEPGEEMDEEAIRAHYKSIGQPVPMAAKAGRAGAMRVTRLKKKEAA